MFRPSEIARLWRGPAKPRTAAASGAFVFVIDDGAGRVKVEASTDPYGRLAVIRATAPRAKIAYATVTPGAGADIEREAAVRLAQHRAGDWYMAPVEAAVAALSAAAFKLGEPVQPIKVNMIERIRRVAAGRTWSDRLGRAALIIIQAIVGAVGGLVIVAAVALLVAIIRSCRLASWRKSIFKIAS